MTQRIVHTRETFGRVPAASVLADRVFDRCTFGDSWIPRPKEGYARAERLDFIGCSVKAQRGFSNVDCHQVRVHGMAKKSARILANDFLFDRVMLEGDFTSEICLFWTATSPADPRAMRAERFYASLPSFALDVRNARFASVALRGVPGHLVVRDPETSALVHRSAVEADPSWCERDTWGTPTSLFGTEIDLFLDAAPKWESCVLVIGTLGKRTARERAELAELKRRRFAE